MSITDKQAIQQPKIDRLRRAFWTTAENVACTVFRHLLRSKATDITKHIADRSALILAPHADDETLGCGGVIALKRSAGTQVTVAIATDGSASHRTETWENTSPEQLVALRQTETQTACETLGLAAEELHFLKFTDGELTAQTSDLAASVANLLDAVQPQEVYVCAERDGHPDHTALAQATHRALRDYNGDVRVLEYPVWCFDFRSWRVKGKTNTKGFIGGLKDMRHTIRRWDMVSVRIGPILNLKSKALAAHKSQLGTYDAEPHWSGLPDSFTGHFLTKTEIFRQVPPPDGAPK